MCADSAGFENWLCLSLPIGCCPGTIAPDDGGDDDDDDDGDDDDDDDDGDDDDGDDDDGDEGHDEDNCVCPGQYLAVQCPRTITLSQEKNAVSDGFSLFLRSLLLSGESLATLFDSAFFNRFYFRDILIFHRDVGMIDELAKIGSLAILVIAIVIDMARCCKIPNAQCYFG